MGKQAHNIQMLREVSQTGTGEVQQVARDLLAENVPLTRKQISNALRDKGVETAADFAREAPAFRTLLRLATEIGGEKAMEEFKAAEQDRPAAISQSDAPAESDAAEGERVARPTIPPPPGPGQGADPKGQGAKGGRVIASATDGDVKRAAADAAATAAVAEESRSGPGRKARGARTNARGRDEVHATGRSARE